MHRIVAARYEDPLDWIWTQAAEKLGLRIRRDGSAYASTDGCGWLTIGTDETLDADDCLAQMIVHELCHGLVEGEQSFSLRDWGLTNDPQDQNQDNLVREHACLRLQAALLRPFGLSQLLAPTTEFRSYYDQLPENPLVGSLDPAISPAQQGLSLAQKAPYRNVLQTALAQTAAIHQLCQEAVKPQAATTGQRDALPTLWQQPRPLMHPIGVAQGSTHTTCATCVWLTPKNSRWICRRAQQRLPAADSVFTTPSEQSCVLYESNLTCTNCAACCRSAFDVVPISPRELIRKTRPDFTEHTAQGWQMRRQSNACIALAQATTSTASYHCTVYEQRPKTCRDVAPGESACLTARIRMGLCL